MGNLCQANIETPVVYKHKKRHMSSSLNGDNELKQNQIKQFLTLTSQNTESFFDSSAIHETNKLEIEQNHQRNIQDFNVVRGLGKGAFGQVYLVKQKDKNKSYAMKIIAKNKIQSQKQKIHALSQRKILQVVDHPFIVKLHYAFQSQNKLYLLVDFMSGGQLFYLLRRKKVFPEEVAKFYTAEILVALEYLHSRNIIYRDLKPENVLLGKDGHIKLADFGLSKVCRKKEIVYSMCGTLQYMAPQIILGKGYTETADWFSFGSILYDMLTGKPPFYSKNKHEIQKNIISKPVPLPQHLSYSAKSLLKQLFRRTPENRIGFRFGAKQIKEHQFFSEMNFDKLLKKQIKPPITFVESQLNDEGFDQNFKEVSSNSLLEDRNNKGVVYDGFTYFIPEIQSFNKEQSSKEIDFAFGSKTDLKHFGKL